MAKGRWCCFVDADDGLPDNALKLLASQAQAPATDIVFGNGRSIGMEVPGRVDINTFRHLAVRAEGTIGVPWGSLYRTACLTPYLFDLPKEVMMGEDYIFWLRLIFSTDEAVAVVPQNTYLKGDDHTSSRFVWTTGYAERIDMYRTSAIPEAVRDEFMPDRIADRIATLMPCTLVEPKKTWRHSNFYESLLTDMHKANRPFSFKERLFLSLPARWLRRMYSRASNRLRR